MRVAVVAECFLPEINGVTNSVLRILDHLEATGHETIVIAPGDGPQLYREIEVVRVRSVSFPLYRSLAMALPGRRVGETLTSWRPDVVYLAAPVLLGAMAARAARDLGVPTVASYQTDLAGFARRYHLSAATPAIWTGLRYLHSQIDLTLAPSTAAVWDLRHHHVDPVALWPRGVDLERFDARYRSSRWRRHVAAPGEVIVGYVGRLAVEKRVHLLEHLHALTGVRVVVVGDGPHRRRLQRRLPHALFTGFLSGTELSRAVASLDVFVHTGSDETFCQAVQEALAAGVPVVAPARGGPLDLVRHRENGFLYPAGDGAMMAQAVATMVADDSGRHRMGAAARASVEGRSWPTVMARLVDYLESVRRHDRARRRRAA